MPMAEPSRVEKSAYKGYTIAVCVYKMSNGRYKATYNIEKLQGNSTSAVGFGTEGEFATEEAALEATIQAGRSQIDNHLPGDVVAAIMAERLKQ